MIRMRAEFFNLSEGQINHMLIFRDAPEASLPHAAFYDEVWRFQFKLSRGTASYLELLKLQWDIF